MSMAGNAVLRFESTDGNTKESVLAQDGATQRVTGQLEIAVLEDPLDLAHVDYTPSDDPRQERADLEGALASARRELHDVRDEVGDRFGPEFSAVFNTHIQILEDKGFVGKLEEAVARTADGLAAIREVQAAYQRMFEGIADPFFRERGSDVEDVARRVMAKNRLPMLMSMRNTHE